MKVRLRATLTVANVTPTKSFASPGCICCGVTRHEKSVSLGSASSPYQKTASRQWKRLFQCHLLCAALGWWHLTGLPVLLIVSVFFSRFSPHLPFSSLQHIKCPRHAMRSCHRPIKLPK